MGSISCSCKQPIIYDPRAVAVDLSHETNDSLNKQEIIYRNISRNQYMQKSTQKTTTKSNDIDMVQQKQDSVY